MKKTLVVQYTPRIGSNTKKLVDHFMDINQDKTEITILNLSKNPPTYLLEDSLNLYVRRNFMGEILNEKELDVLAKNDKMAEQVLNADFIVLAFPIHNFSLPSVVKSWIDAISQIGKTVITTETGYKGLCGNTQALTLITSGGDFSIEPYKSIDFASPLIKTCFNFLGIENINVSAFGIQQYSDEIDNILETAKQEIFSISKKWYQ